jgi:transposase-like protein
VLDETYLKVGKEWKYLYRAVDSMGNAIEFMLSAKRDVYAAKRFFKKLMRADHRRLPFTIGTDKHASYPEAFATSVKEKVLPLYCKLRRVKLIFVTEPIKGRGHTAAGEAAVWPKV